MFRQGILHIYSALILLAVCSGAQCAWEAEPEDTLQLPRPEHIVIAIFENKNFDQVYDTSAAPYIQSLLQDPHTAVFTRSLAMGHPSQPNYFWMFSGDDQQMTTNDRPPYKFNTPNLADALLDAGYDFVTYSEGLPYTGYDGDQHGYYVRKHNPVANWMGVEEHQVPIETNKPFTAFPVDPDDLPTVSYVVPDLINGMHDGSIEQGDAWLELHLSEYIEYAKTHNALFILTFDETGYDVTDNRILTFVVGRDVVPGTFDTPVSHVNWLRTIEDMYDLPHSGMAAYLEPVSGCWRTE